MFHYTRAQVGLRHSHIDDMYTKLRNHSKYSQAYLVYIPENLPSAHGSDIVYDTNGLPRTIVMTEFGKDRRPGVPKGAEETNEMMPMLERMFKAGAVKYASDVMTYGTQDVEEQLTKLESELLAMRFVYQKEATDDPFAKVGGKWTGKYGPLKRDDGAVALAMIPYWRYKFLNSADPSYMEVVSSMRYTGGRRRAVAL